MSESKRKLSFKFKAFLVFLTIILLASTLPFLYQEKDFIIKQDYKPFTESKFINIDNYQVHYREWNSDIRNPDRKIFLVHGFYGSTSSWEAVINDLKKSNDYIVAVDIPGFGFSSKNSGFNHSSEHVSNFLWKFLDEINANNQSLKTLRWTFVGHSLGGQIVSEMTLNQPLQIKELILIDPSIQYTGKKIVNNNSSFDNALFRKYVEISAKFYFFQHDQIKSFLKSAYGKEPSENQVQNYLKPLQESKSASAASEIFFTSTSTTLDLSKINIRTLVVFGEKDTWIDQTDFKYIKDHITNSTSVTVNNAGHVPQETNSTAVTLAIKDFWGK